MNSRTPFTHHEILALVEPFTRRGRRVDLDASNRLERRLLFKAVEHVAETVESQGLRETLKLENPYPGTYRLTRVLTLNSGLAASLTAEGPHPDQLLSHIESITPQSQFCFGKGFTIAYNHQLESRKSQDAVTTDEMAAVRSLTHGVAQIGDLTLTLKMPTVRGYPADIQLMDKTGDVVNLPEDLIAVIGWDWAPLKRSGVGWNSKLRIRGKEPNRSRRAEDKLKMTAQHLAETLAEPPRRFHERFVRARWGAAVRRTIPILSCIIVVVIGTAVPLNVIDENPVLRLLVMNAPLWLIGLSFTLQELSRIEIPPLPRASKPPAWRQPKKR